MSAYVISFECPLCGDIVWGDQWIRKDGNAMVSLGFCSDGQGYLIKLKFRFLLNNKVQVKRFVYELTDERRLDYDECLKQQEAWNKYVK